MKSDTVTNVAMLALALCALTTTSLVVKREFFPPPSPPQGPKLSTVSKWRELAQTGTVLYDSPRAPVTVVVFSDFQCPGCKYLSGLLEKLREAYAGQVKVVVRHFPLESIHPYAFEAALASECANDVGRFVEMEHALYKNQASISTDRWGTIAADAGINDTIKLVNCVRDSAHIARIREDAATGNRLNIRGTPTVFVNDVRIDGGVSYELLDSLTQAKLPKKMAGRQ
jgi:protein-disulfide isomerase